MVQAILSEADRDWFAQALQTELEKLGNWERFHAMLGGSGAIAQGRGVAVVNRQGEWRDRHGGQPHYYSDNSVLLKRKQ